MKGNDLQEHIEQNGQTSTERCDPARRRWTMTPVTGASGLRLRVETSPGTGTDHSPTRAHPVAIDATLTRDEVLDKAVNAIIPAALEQRQGILVTRHGPGSYTVDVDASVPCGCILERAAS